jgi:integrase
MYKRGNTYWERITAISGASKCLSLKTTNEKVAKKMCAWLDDVRDRLDPHGVLDALLAGDLSVAHAYQLGERGFAAQQRAKVEALADLDVHPYVAEWLEWLTRRKLSAGSLKHYEAQIDVVLPSAAGRRVSMLTTQGLWKRLDDLTVAETTKGRYRAALSSFCQYLVRRGVLTNNPCRDIVGYPQAQVRMESLSAEEGLKLLAALPPQYAAAEALMFACGWELSAVVNAKAGDIDLANLTAFARGSKSIWRRRLTIITEPEVVKYLEPILRHKLPEAPLFTLSTPRLLATHKETSKALGLPITTLHDWRHTYAIKELKRGTLPQHVAQMLGHSTAALVINRYGRWISTPDELMAASQSRRATVTATVSR